MNQALFDAITTDDETDKIKPHLTDLDSPNAEGHTPLEHAFLIRAYMCAEALLKAGATPRLSPAVATKIYEGYENGNYSPLGMTLYYSHRASARCLLDSGVPADDVDSNGMHPIHWAARAGFTDVVTTMLERGVPVDQPHEDALNTPLVEAVQHNRFEVVQLLLARGASNDPATKVGASIRERAQKNPKILALVEGRPVPEDDFIAESKKLTKKYRKKTVTAELDGTLFDHEPATFHFFFRDPEKLREFLEEEYSDEVEDWNWEQHVPVARVGSSPERSEAFATLFLDWKKAVEGVPRLFATTSDNWARGLKAKSLKSLHLHVVDPDESIDR